MSFLFLALILASGLLTPSANAQYTLHTFAGGGSLNGVDAAKVSLRSPVGVAVAPSGDLYVSSRLFHKVYKVSPAGILHTVAGTGYKGLSGDGGPAASATLAEPEEIALDAAGNLYILDRGNSRIRKVSPVGVISTVAGNGAAGLSIDGNLATQVPIGPRSLTADAAGNLFIAEWNRVRKVAVNGIISTVAGNGYQGFAGDGGVATDASVNDPEALAVDPAGNLFIADTGNCRIRKVSTNGNITTIAGTGCFGYSGDGGPATQAVIHGVEGITADAAGNVYISDSGNYRVRQIDANGIITTIAGRQGYGRPGDGGPATEAYLTFVRQLALDSSGNLYIADLYNDAVRKVSTTGIISSIVGNDGHGTYWESGPATGAQIYYPAYLSVDSSGNIYFSNLDNRVRKASSAGFIAPTVPSILNGQATAFDAAGNMFFADRFRIQKVSPNGNITHIAGTGESGFSGDGGPAISARFSSARDLALDRDGNLYFADTENHRIRKVSTSGIITTVAGNGAQTFCGDGGPATAACLFNPFSIAFDGNDNLYIADLTNYRIRRVSPNGIISTIAGNGQRAVVSGNPALATPAAAERIAIDRSGNIFFTGGGQVLRIRHGVVETVAGAGGMGFTEDGAPAYGAAITQPQDVAVDEAGNVYFSEINTPNGDRIRVLRPALTSEPSSLSFTYVVGANPPPTRIIHLSYGTVAANIFASVSSGAVWLSVTPSILNNPGALTVSVDASSLPPGTYSGSILLTSFNATTTVPVTLTVAAFCTYTISPASHSANSAAASGYVYLNANLTCPWTAMSNNNWIHITSAGFGLGPTYLYFQLDANTGPARTGSISIAGQTFAISQSAAPGVQTSGYRFIPVVPCRLLDTRLANGPFGGPRLEARETRSFTLPSTNCGIPSNAAAYSVNATVVPAGPLSYLTLWPSGESQPHVSTLNSFDGRIKANAAIVPAGTNGAISVFVTDPTHFVLDINGYFIPSSAGGSSFHISSYCRIYYGLVDPPVAAGQSRTIDPHCNVHASATAYALNVSVRPSGTLGFLTVWPTGHPQPFVSTLNSLTGAVTSNAAIVQSGASGTVNIFATDNTDLTVHLSGYFAPPGLAGETSFHPVKPCRVADTRLPDGPFGGPMLRRALIRRFPVALSTCGVPSTARAFSFNVTLVPIGPTAEVNLAPYDGITYISDAYLLQSLDGSVVASAAILQADPNGGITASAYQDTHLILDINGYFQ